LKKRLIFSDSPSNASAAGDSLVMDNPSSSSGVVSFNRVLSTTNSKPVGAQDDSFLGDELIADLQADPVPLRTSTPIVTNTVPAEFDDLAIQMVQDLLHKHHPDIAGLQFVSFGEFRGNQLSRFASAAGVRFVQTLNVVIIGYV